MGSRRRKQLAHGGRALVADKRSGDGPAIWSARPRTRTSRSDVEFWASDDANSGIFIRCQNPKEIGDRSCYEVNIFDQRPDPTYGTGGIVHFAEVNPMPKAGGKWNTFEITAKGRVITVQMNGQKTVELRNGHVGRGTVRAPARRGRDEVPQSRDQAALAAPVDRRALTNWSAPPTVSVRPTLLLGQAKIAEHVARGCREAERELARLLGPGP